MNGSNVSPEFQATLDKARARLVLRHPFFGSLLLRFPLDLSGVVPTAAVDKKGKIYVNPAFAEKLSPEELQFLLAHEVMHVVFAHHARRGGREPELWNVVNDLIINDILVKEGVGKMVEGGLYQAGASEHTSEELYASMMQNGKQAGQASGSSGKGEDKKPGGQQQAGNGDSDLTIRDLVEAPDSGEPMSEAEAQAQIQQGKVDIASAATAAKMSGKLSENMARVLGKYIASRVPWWQVLEQYFVGHAQQHSSWSRPNKRYRHVYLPRREPMPSMGTVVIAVDTSGSIGPEELQKYFGHINGLIEQVRPEKVVVLYTSTRVVGVEEYTPNDYPINTPETVPSDGGTDMRAAVRWVCEHAEDDPDVTLILTDGYTPVPRAEDVRGSLIWVTTSRNFEHMAVPGDVIYDVE